MDLLFPPVAEADLDDLVALLSSETWPFHGDPQPTAARVRERVAEGAWTRGPDTAPHWIELGGERVGLVTLRELEDPTPVFDLRLRAACRGRGIGGRALEWLARETFEVHGKHRLEGHTRRDNRAMRRVFERSPGWVLEGCYRQAWPDPAGAWHDALAYALLARDWREGTVTSNGLVLAGD
ncbi:MAG: GNAT family N-acetyltransferase [Planctomycetota bacterium]